MIAVCEVHVGVVVGCGRTIGMQHVVVGAQVGVRGVVVGVETWNGIVPVYWVLVVSQVFGGLVLSSVVGRVASLVVR